MLVLLGILFKFKQAVVFFDENTLKKTMESRTALKSMG
jgi:hypothetical protein